MAIHFDMNDLRLVIHVAEMNSLTGGAGKVFLSLPAASTRLRRLEESIGVKLFNRTAQGLTLTQAGRVVVRHSRLVSLQVERMCGELHQYVNGLKGTLRIAASTTAAMEMIPALLPAYIAAYTAIDVEVVERQDVDIVRAVAEGAAEIGMVCGHVKHSGLESIPCRDDRLVLVSSPDHALCSADRIDFAATLAYDHVGLKGSSALTQFLTKVAFEAQLTMRFRATVADFEAVCRIAEANAAIGILPESVASRHAQSMRIQCAELTDDWARQKPSMVVKKATALPNFANGFIDMMTGTLCLQEAA